MEFVASVRNNESYAFLVTDVAERLFIDVNTHTYRHTEHVTHTIELDGTTVL